MNRRVLTILALSAPLMAACGGLTSRTTPAETYRLTPIVVSVGPQHADGALVVARPVARPGLDGDRMAVTLPDHRVDAYAGARWIGPLPTLTEGLLLDALRGRGVAPAVLSERDGFAGKYRLQTEILTFSADYGAEHSPPTVRVALRGQLGLDAGTRRILGEVSGQGEARAVADRRGAVAEAFQAAWSAALEAYVSRVGEVLGANAGAEP
jgi:ABC-type uncharacterized transport system auxiliary subunit